MEEHRSYIVPLPCNLAVLANRFRSFATFVPPLQVEALPFTNAAEMPHAQPSLLRFQLCGTCNFSPLAFRTLSRSRAWPGHFAKTASIKRQTLLAKTKSAKASLGRPTRASSGAFSARASALLFPSMWRRSSSGTSAASLFWWAFIYRRSSMHALASLASGSSLPCSNTPS